MDNEVVKKLLSRYKSEIKSDVIKLVRKIVDERKKRIQDFTNQKAFDHINNMSSIFDDVEMVKNIIIGDVNAIFKELRVDVEMLGCISLSGWKPKEADDL